MGKIWGHDTMAGAISTSKKYILKDSTSAFDRTVIGCFGILLLGVIGGAVERNFAPLIILTNWRHHTMRFAKIAIEQQKTGRATINYAQNYSIRSKRKYIVYRYLSSQGSVKSIVFEII